MTKQTGTIITIVAAIITLLCCTAPLCSMGIFIFTGPEWSSELGMQTDTIPPAAGIAPCCLSILVLIVPVLCWLFLVRGKEDTTGIEVEEEYEGIIEDDISYE